VLGGVLDPHAAYLLIRGLKTLELRVHRQNATGQRVAEFLEAHPAVERVYYPGLASHPDHPVARDLMRGHGGVVSFLVRGDETTTSRFIDRCTIPRIGPSLGGVESLIEQPALMSFYELTERAAPRARHPRQPRPPQRRHRGPRRPPPRPRASPRPNHLSRATTRTRVTSPNPRDLLHREPA
jgi:cystathionine beta-lyase/cystathionine gamma-synthase